VYVGVGVGIGVIDVLLCCCVDVSVDCTPPYNNTHTHLAENGGHRSLRGPAQQGAALVRRRVAAHLVDIDMEIEIERFRRLD